MIRFPIEHVRMDILLESATLNFILLIGAYLFFSYYTIYNLYTDIKFRRTSNIQHIVFLILGLCYFDYVHPNSLIVLFVMLIALIFGIIIEKMRTSSPGDTKMFVVMSVWITSFTNDNLIHQTLVFCVTTYLLQLGIGWISWIRKEGFLNALKQQREQLILVLTPGAPLGKEVIFENWPGAVNMCLGAILTLLAGGVFT